MHVQEYLKVVLGGDFPEVPYFEMKKQFYTGLLETFKDEVLEKLKEDLLGILVYGTPGERLEDISKKDIDIIVVVQDAAFNEKNKKDLSEIKKYIENHEENIYKVKIDGAMLPKSDFEEKLRRIKGNSNLPIEICDINEWLTQYARTTPAHLLLPYYEKENYLRRAVESAEPVKKPIETLGKYKF